MSFEELRRQSLGAALGDIRRARVAFDDVAAWVAVVGDSPEDPLGADVWVFDAGLSQVLLVQHPWRGWVAPGGQVEPGETPRDAARRELFEETGVEAELFDQPAGVNVRSYHPERPASLSLSYAAIVDSAVPLVGEPGQPAAWMKLDQSWESCFPEDVSRIRQHAEWLAGGGRM
ncbi:NUDIX domain-containing protein [Actinoplanes friuliensis]|uniref:MutT/nudix family protein n=1 Tax=Actinoplanes friuliensis DSM 7358 TaxID=1246995 RepID=U5VNI8_9ACTN|nr:NUDIX hydrolase [Actinoplanes friuliensis]AGZ38362.1 MutT/nudix family protein [Actinoplanes friuliensis DSM 7358]